MKISKLISTLVLVVGFTLVSAPEIPACQCKKASEVFSTANKSDAVFAGAVTEMIEARIGAPPHAKFSVEKRWKGVETGEAEIYIDGGCWVRFKPGERYIVLAVKDKYGRLTADSCSVAGLSSVPPTWLKKFGKPKPIRTRKPTQ
jgi:hypothetical protein